MADDSFEQSDGFESVAERMAAEALIVDVDGFEGPLDLLADAVAHAEGGSAQDLGAGAGAAISGLCRKAKALRIELAADYLVMAAWLAFLKSRLLLPPDPTEEGPSGEELAAHLAFQLERLQAMREARPS